MKNSYDIVSTIEQKAKDLKFDCVGIASAIGSKTLAQRLNVFLAKHYHGTMGWMEARQQERANPQSLWPEARSVIMLGLNYGPHHDPLQILKQKSHAAISVYAHNRDYHDIIKKRLKQLARWIITNHGGDVKVFVDTAPVMEKPLATQAGIGWQGKHTNLVSREFGSWLFLGSIFTTLSLPYHKTEYDHCGSCQACLDICPTNAFPAPYQLDARRCISYLTIEHKTSIPEEFRKAIGNRIYGCDDCLAVCPWNKFAQHAHETAFHSREVLKAPLLKDFLHLDDQGFRQFFSGSPIKRIGRDRFMRNVLIAAGNTADPSLIEFITPLLADDNEIVRETAQWALYQLTQESHSS